MSNLAYRCAFALSTLVLATAATADGATPGVTGATADVSITKTLDTPGPYWPGQFVQYTLTYSNAGPSTATNVQVNDTPTNMMPGYGACTTFPCTIFFVAAGTNGMIQVTQRIAAPGAFDNVATVTANEFDPNTANNTDNTGNGGTADFRSDVSISKTLDTAGPFVSGQTISYTLTVANAGPNAATNVEITDSAFNLTITSVSGGGCSAMPCTIANLASGANVVITLSATIDAAGSFNNIASVAASEADPDSANNTDNTDNGGFAATTADVSTTITDTPDPVLAGQPITYQITMTNAGPDQAGSIRMELPLPAGTTFVSQSNDGSWNCLTPAVGTNGTVSCGPFFGSQPIGVVHFTVVATVAPSLADGTVLTATATTTAMFTPDPVPANNSGAATTTVTGLALESSVPVPALDRFGQLLIALLVLGFAAMTLRRTSV